MPMTDAPNCVSEFGWRKPHPRRTPPPGCSAPCRGRAPSRPARPRFCTNSRWRRNTSPLRVGADLCVRPETPPHGTRPRADTQVGPHKMRKADGISVGADAFIGSSRAGQLAAAKREAAPCDDHPDDLRTIRHGTAVPEIAEDDSVPEGRPKSALAPIRRPPSRGGANAPERV